MSDFEHFPDADERVAMAYQAVGALATHAGLFEHPMTTMVLDMLSDPTKPVTLIPGWMAPEGTPLRRAHAALALALGFIEPVLRYGQRIESMPAPDQAALFFEAVRNLKVAYEALTEDDPFRLPGSNEAPITTDITTDPSK